MGTILKPLFVFFVGAFLVCILIPVVSVGSAINKSAKKDSERLTTVSYTHLTLPTIYTV